MDSEDDVNFNICILCQGTNSGTLVETPELKSVDNVIEVVKERVIYKDTSVTNVSKRIKDLNAEQLIGLKLKYHKECYSLVTNKTLLRRAKEKYDKAIQSKNAEQITPKRGRPIKRVLEDQSPEIAKSVGLGMHVYYRTRSKELLDCLSNLNLSITYDKTLQIQTSMANAVCKVIDENNGSFIPPSVNKEKRVFFAIDNTDFKNDTPNGKGEFRGTGMIICQRYDGQEIKNVPIERSSSNKIRFQEDRFSYIYKCYRPKLPDINYEKTEVAKGDSMNTFIKSDLIWAIQKLFDDSENPIILTWSAYNALITHSLPKTIYCGLPLLRGSPTDWSNLYIHR